MASGTGVCKTPYLRFISADVHKYWFTANIIPYLCAAPCPIFIVNPQPERESDIDASADRLPTPVQLIDAYLTSTLTGARAQVSRPGLCASLVPRPMLSPAQIAYSICTGKLGLAQCLHIPCSVTGMLAEVFAVRSEPQLHCAKPSRGLMRQIWPAFLNM